MIVKGMEMPKNCWECSLSDIDDDYGRCCLYSGIACLTIGRQDNCPLVEIPTPHGDLVDLSDMVHPNDSMRRMTIDEQLRRTCEGWSADRKQYVVIEAEGSEVTE